LTRIFFAAALWAQACRCEPEQPVSTRSGLHR